MEVDELLVGLTLLASIGVVMSGLRPWRPVAVGEEELMADLCACASRPFNATLVYNLYGMVIIGDGRVELEVESLPSCCTPLRGGYSCPFRPAVGARLVLRPGYHKLRLYSTGNGTCIVGEEEWGG